MSKPMFTHSSGNYRIPMIGAMKKDDKSWETEEECKSRVKDMFDVDDVECFWDDSVDPPGFVAGTRDSDEPDEPEGPTEAELAGDKVVEGMPEGDDGPEEDPDELPEHSLEVEEESEPDVESSEDESSPDEEDVTEEPEPAGVKAEPTPSDDGERVYELKPLAESVKSIEDYFTKWPWNDDDGSLLAKLTEEYNEAMEGGNEPFEKEGNTITLVGTSTLSEIVTVAIICAKLFHKEGLSFEDFISLMCARHSEQYERYHDIRTDAPSVEESES